jgi:L-seryl-tRNA(Ser) seleniumtransferase
VVQKVVDAKELLKGLPSVDEVLRSPAGEEWLARYPRRYVIQGVRDAIQAERERILEGEAGAPGGDLTARMEERVRALCSLSLRPVINATGIVIHTNLGRSPLPERALQNMLAVARGYSNLEYDLAEGKRGKRYAHVRRLLRDVTGAEDGIAVNNNAGAVLLSLSALARGGEVVVSRGELVEIGGSFRIPDVMAQSGAVLREVGATNKTHLGDYEAALTAETALILKVHQSNYRIVGFSEDVPVRELVRLGRERGVPVMYDMGSGCLMDLAPWGIGGEPSVADTLGEGPDLVTFSGDKLLGGPQAGLVVGRKALVQAIERHPLTRALRIDKLTLAALEAVLMTYADPERARTEIPTLRMLCEEAGSVKRRARRMAAAIRKEGAPARVSVLRDTAYSGGGALPEQALPTYAVSVAPLGEMSPNALEERLRKGDPPVIARIREGVLLLDARTVQDGEIRTLARSVLDALAEEQAERA